MRPKLHAIADHLRRSAQEAKERGDLQSALAFYEAVVMLDADADPQQALTESKYSPRVGSMTMDAEHREAISKGRAKRNPLMRAAREHGYPTMDALCDALKAAARADKIALKVSPSFLSQVVSKTKKLPPDLGRYLLALTGWEP